MTGWRAGGSDKTAMEILDTAPEKHIHADLHPRPCRGGRVRTAPGAAWISMAINPMTQPTQANTPTLFTPCHTGSRAATTSEKVGSWAGEADLGGSLVATVGTYLGSTQKEPRMMMVSSPPWSILRYM